MLHVRVCCAKSRDVLRIGAELLRNLPISTVNGPYVKGYDYDNYPAVYLMHLSIRFHSDLATSIRYLNELLCSTETHSALV